MQHKTESAAKRILYLSIKRNSIKEAEKQADIERLQLKLLDGNSKITKGKITRER